MDLIAQSKTSARILKVVVSFIFTTLRIKQWAWAQYQPLVSAGDHKVPECHFFISVRPIPSNNSNKTYFSGICKNTGLICLNEETSRDAYLTHLTFLPSCSLVSMTITCTFCSQIICQKSAIVLFSGP